MLAYQQVFTVEQGVKIIVLTAYYPQTDSQTKRLNQTLKQYLRYYINYVQNNQVLLLLIAQFTYNTTPQKKLKILPFKANYGYELRILLSLQQVKKSSETAKERVETLINLYKDLKESAKLVQERIKRYYNLKVFEGLDLKKGDKVQLLYKNILSRRLSKKLNYIKLGLFKIKKKITEVNYKLDLPAKIKIYLIQYIAMLEPAHGEHELLTYKIDIYKGREEDEQEVQKIVDH